MHSIDYLIIVLLIWGIFRGYVKGLLLQVAHLLSFLMIILFGLRLSVYLSIYFVEVLSLSTWFLPVISFLIVVILLLFLGWATGKILTGFIKLTPAAWLNSIGGAILGLLKMSLIIGFMLRFLYAVDNEENIITPNLKKQSITMEPLVSMTFFVEPIFEDITRQFEQMQFNDEHFMMDEQVELDEDLP